MANSLRAGSSRQSQGSRPIESIQGEDILEYTQCEDIVQSTHDEIIIHPIMPLPTNHVMDSEARFKYIDDLSICQAINLSDLQTINYEVERPLNYRDRTLHFLPPDKNTLQKSFNNVQKFCAVQKSVVNDKKSKTVIFNTSNKKDFTPRIVND